MGNKDSRLSLNLFGAVVLHTSQTDLLGIAVAIKAILYL